MNDLYQPYFNLILNPLIPRGGQTQPSPEEMSLHRYPSEFLTRQSFDARALTSPPFPLSQHLSRSRGVPDRYRQCASDSAGTKTKKAVKTDPGGSVCACDAHSPLAGSEPDLTAFQQGFQLLLCVNFKRISTNRVNPLKNKPSPSVVIPSSFPPQQTGCPSCAGRWRRTQLGRPSSTATRLQGQTSHPSCSHHCQRR
jgi:hypothetical protein